MNSIIRRSLPAALSAALVAGALAVPAIATTHDTTTGETAVEHEGRRGPGPRGLEEGELAERLAAELDLDTATVQAALDAVHADLAAERLARAVEDGRLTQEQADRLAAAAEDGTLDEVRQEIRLETLEARLAEKVAAGELTQEEADEILADAEDGELPRRGGRRGHHRPGRGDDGPAADADTTSA